MQKRQELGLTDRSLKPWTTKPGVSLRGASKQMSAPNFVCELLDVRVMQACKRAGVPLDRPTVEVFKHLLADIRQDLNFQLAGGQVSLLSGSRVYAYILDRCLTAPEHMMSNGWCLSDTTMDQCNLDVKGTIQEGLSGVPAKRRRGKMPTWQNLIVELAGNAQSLPELSLYSLPAIFAINRCGLFNRDISHEDVRALCAVDAGNPCRSIELDPDMDQTQLRAMHAGPRKFVSADVHGESDGGDSE